MARLRLLLVALVLALPLVLATAVAQDVEQPPPSVEELLRLLAEPEVQSWLAERAPAAASETTEAEAETEGALETLVGELHIGAAVTHWHGHRDRLIAALPQLPYEIGQGLGRLRADAARGGPGAVLALVAVFVAAGFAAEWAFARATRQLRRRVLTADETTVKERLQKLALRLGLVIGATLAFAAASLGIFVTIDLPPLVREVAGRFLFAIIVFRLIRYIALLMLSPAHPQRRIMPIGDARAAFWLTRISAFVGLFAFGWALATSLGALGIPRPHPTIIAYILGIGLVAITIEAIWRRPAVPTRQDVQKTSPPPETIDEPGPSLIAAEAMAPAAFESPEPILESPAEPAAKVEPASTTGGRAGKIALSAYAVLVFGLWLTDARAAMWLAIVAAFLPLAVSVVNAAVNNLLRPIGEAVELDHGPPTVLAAAIERGARALLIVLAALFLLWAWDIDLAGLAGEDTETSPIIAALLSIAIIVIVFDFFWHVGRTAIDRYIEEAESGEVSDPAEARRRARLRTLLPIGRNVLQAVLGVTAILMILAAVGVQIAPLIAGAGVVGVAVGFGSQTLVRDLMSGMFYLLDDAFRVGEYIVADKYKGTVESFSLRSIKLRHHRGPLYTIPFGSLGAIQNMSREWVIVKLAFTVPFETDVDKVKKVIKGVNAELQADPELARGFLEPLKSQGADEIAPHGIIIRVKFKAIPGTQFPIRRRANALIKQAFAENGIKFAYPTVQVAGSGDEAAAAKALLDDQATRAAE